MYDATDARPRYLVHYSDGGSGVRRSEALLGVGDERRDGGNRYRVVHVEHRANEHAWAELIDAG